MSPLIVSHRRKDGWHVVLRALRFAGALAILAVGAVHLQEYVGAGYQAIPTIGPLFLLNAIGSGIVGVLLLLPLQRVLAGGRGDAAVALLAVTAVAIAIGSLIALFISDSTSLFGFSETGYRAAIVVAIIAEAATILLLGPVAAVSLARAFRSSPGRGSRAGGSRTVDHPPRRDRVS
jgi:hypothetical protein